MDRITQSVAKRVVLKAFLSSDHISKATGKTIAVVISKNGAAFGNPNAGATNATEIAQGWYYVDLDTTDTGTLGPLIVRGTEGTIDDVEIAFSVEQSIQAEANAALVANHLDHLLAATYDPASKPGASDALLNELVENDGGVSRFTANALEQAPSGGSAPTVEEIADEVETRSLTIGTNNDKTGYALTSGERDSIADALLDRSNGVETGLTPRGALRLQTAAMAGKVSGGGTSTVTIRNVGDSKNRIVATVDADGNRSAVTTDAT